MTSVQLGLFSPRWSTVDRPCDQLPFEDPFLAASIAALDIAGDNRLTFDEERWDYNARSAVGLDVEVYNNFLVICFKRFVDGTRIAFERSQRSNFNAGAVESILTANTIITFNGNFYDLPIVFLALSGADTSALKQASDQIIFANQRDSRVRVPRLNHIDLIEPNPSVQQGLKMLHARLHGRYIVDLPYKPNATLTPRQMNVVTLYCFNDLDATQGLYSALREPLELRVALGRRYGGMDLRSKSDSQIGETIVRHRVERATGKRLAKPEFDTPLFEYRVPDFIQFDDSVIKNVVDELHHTTFYVNGAGKTDAPDILKNLKIRLGRMTYTLGIGGLHSTEAHRALLSNDDHGLIDVDVASQYPNIIKNLGLYPKALGPDFLAIYSELIRERLAAKAAGDKVAADGGRIALNGVYGKLGSPYSVLYAPHLLIAVTLTGQLAVLMLIERAESAGIPVVSANTDGVVFYCPRPLQAVLDGILAQWEHDTGFAIERTPYRALYSSSVNTYIAIKEDGKVKRKGWISNPWAEGDIRGQLMKNPQMTICSDAATEFLAKGIPVEDTIRGCKDPRAFVTVIKATSGGTWRGHDLGRIIRYYWSLDGEPILTAGTRRVPKTEGARPMPEMSEELPQDVDVLRYCEEAQRLIIDLGG